MSADPRPTREWAQAHKAAWELLPLVEMHDGARVQVGFQLQLYARLPPGVEPEARDRALPGIWDRLRQIAESLAEASPACRLEVAPYDAAGRLRPETGFAPEVLVEARLSHADDYFEPVDAADRLWLRPVEDRLRELGFRERSW